MNNTDSLRFTIDIKGVPVGFVAVKGGVHPMGSNFSRSNRWPWIRVRLDGYSISEFPVTQDLFECVMGWNPSLFKGPRLPVTNVSHTEALDFCKRVSESAAGGVFRLPTEAEWEVAARCGGRQAFSGSDDIDEVGWYSGNSGLKPQPVGGKKPNRLGIHDMSGNVWEWCLDVYRDKYADRPWPFSPTSVNPKGIPSGNNRVVRGGCFLYTADACRSVARSFRVPSGRCSYVGFRIVFVV